MKRALSLLGIVAMLIAPGAAVAGQSTSVDPLLMQPPLNATFDWSCFRTGGGIICDGTRTITWENVEYGIECDGRPIWSTGYETRHQRRYGDSNGLALMTIQHFQGHDIASLQPDMSGPLLYGMGSFKEVFEYGVPGDISTRTDRYSGVDVKVTAPGYGLVFHDTGTKMFDIEDNVLMLHGHHPVVEDFEGTFAKMCDAFEALGA